MDVNKKIDNNYIRSDNYLITKNKDIYEIFLLNINDNIRSSLINSLVKTNLIKGGIIYGNNESIKIKAISLEPLNLYLKRKIEETKETKIINKSIINKSIINDLIINDKLFYNKNDKYNIIYKIIKDLVIQMKYLIDEESKLFIGYNKDDIIVINEEIFIYLGSQLLMDLDVNLDMNIYIPYDKSDFYFSPELNNIRFLPTKISYKSSYYSFGYLINILLECLRNDELINYVENENYKNNEDYPDKLNNFLNNCLNRNINDRFIIFI